MKKLTSETFAALAKQAKIQPRLLRDLRFGNGTAELSAADWEDRELLAITDRSGNKGVLILQPSATELFIIAFELSRGLTTSSGRLQAIVCDFCYTWQAGSNAAAISFQKDSKSLRSIRFLCCADLQCSEHVRSKTTSSRLSRANLRETITDEQRVARLQQHIYSFVHDLDLKKIPAT